MDRIPQKHEIYFWRTAAGVEVDFVVKIDQRLYPFEVTFSSQRKTQKIKHLLNFMEAEQAPLGFYLYTGEWHFDQNNKIVFLPAWGVC